MLPERKERATAARRGRQAYTTVGRTSEPKDQAMAARRERRGCTTVGLMAEPKVQPTPVPRENPVYMTVELTAGPERCAAWGAASRGFPALADRTLTVPDVRFCTIGSP